MEATQSIEVRLVFMYYSLDLGHGTWDMVLVSMTPWADDVETLQWTSGIGMKHDGGFAQETSQVICSAKESCHASAMHEETSVQDSNRFLRESKKKHIWLTLGSPVS